MNYYIANRWEVAEAVFGISPTCTYCYGGKKKHEKLIARSIFCVKGLKFRV